MIRSSFSRLFFTTRDELRAAKLAERSHIPAYVVEDEQAGLTAQVIENQLRANLSNSDLPAAIARLAEGGMKVKEIAVVTGLPDWRIRHFRAVPTLPPFLYARLDRADMRALYELQGAWEKAQEPARQALEEAVGRLVEDEVLTVTEARRVITAVTGKPTHSIALDRGQDVETLTGPPPSPSLTPTPPTPPTAEAVRADRSGDEAGRTEGSRPAAPPDGKPSHSAPRLPAGWNSWLRHRTVAGAC